MSLWFSFLARYVYVSHPSNSCISFLKSATKNYCFVLSWIHSTAPNISLSPPFSSSKHFTLTVAQNVRAFWCYSRTLHLKWWLSSFNDLLLSPDRKTSGRSPNVCDCLPVHQGVAEGALTALLHTFHPGKYVKLGLGGEWSGVPMQMLR